MRGLRGACGLVLDEAHVTNIAVRPDRRGLGYGKAITKALVQLAADSGMTWMTLECRRSNLVAQSIYRKLGFVDVGFRKRYYADNNEDALLMALEKLPEAHPENDPAPAQGVRKGNGGFTRRRWTFFPKLRYNVVWRHGCFLTTRA